MQLTSGLDNTLDNFGWLSRWWCVVELTQKKNSQLARLHKVLEGCVLRFTLSYKNNVCNYNCFEMRCGALHFQLIIFVAEGM